MQEFLVVVDMQTDFVNGALGTAEAVGILSQVREKIESFDGTVIFTRDTHPEEYLQTQEGKLLPVPHCIKGSAGWQIVPELSDLVHRVINKPTFGSTELCALLADEQTKERIRRITLIGICTDICVISNALLIKAYLPEVELVVDAACCAGVTPESHRNALSAMKMCQIKIENE